MNAVFKTLTTGFATMAALWTSVRAQEANHLLFDLEFSGGMSTEFVRAVEHASGWPFNLLIPESG